MNNVKINFSNSISDFNPSEYQDKVMSIPNKN